MKTMVMNKLSLSIALLFSLLLFSCHGTRTHPQLVLQTTVLSVGVPVSDFVVFNGFNPYSVAVVPGALYKISITNPSDDVDLRFFGTEGAFVNQATCAVDNTGIIGISAEDCVVQASGSILYFAADGAFISGSSAAFAIDVEEVPTKPSGLGQPLPDGGGQRTAVVYATAVTPGSAFTTALTAMTDDANLYVFSNANLTGPAACANTLFTGTTPEDCTIIAATTTLYAVADGIFSSSATMVYTAITATAAPATASPASEGATSAPVAVSLDTPRTGQVASSPTATSYYVVQGLTAGRYTVSILGLTNDVDLGVYGNDATFTNKATCLTGNNTGFLNTTPEDCTVQISGPDLYFAVQSETAPGAAYLSLIDPGP